MNKLWINLVSVIVGIVVMRVLSPYRFDGCNAYERQCTAEWPKNPDGSNNYYSCYIKVLGTKTGCSTDNHEFMSYCRLNLTGFTCYINNEDIFCPPNLTCRNILVGLVLLFILGIIVVNLTIVYCLFVGKRW